MSDIVIASIVEGHGEVEGLPILLRRIAQERHGVFVRALKPHRVPRAKMVNRPEELERAVHMQAARVGPAGGVIVLADSDDDDPEALRAQLQTTSDVAAAAGGAVVVTIAVREYEAWFLAGIESLRVHKAIRDDASYEADPESPRNPKLKLEEQMVESYGSVRHQVAFNATLDLETTERRAPSFRRFLEAVECLVLGQGTSLGESRGQD